MTRDYILRVLSLTKEFATWPLPDLGASPPPGKRVPTPYELQKWGKAVKERDGFRCAVHKCQSTDDLHAHHILKKSVCPELALRLDNGITLCGACHRNIH